MILTSTVVITMDNSGARRVRCIRVYYKPGRQHARVGESVQVLVLRLRNRGKLRLKQGEMHRALVTRISTFVLRQNGSFFKFDTSSVIIFNKKTKMPLGTRFFGPCAKEVRNYHGFARLSSLFRKLK